jgi:hypothetical protein
LLYLLPHGTTTTPSDGLMQAECKLAKDLIWHRLSVWCGAEVDQVEHLIFHPLEEWMRLSPSGRRTELSFAGVAQATMSLA